MATRRELIEAIANRYQSGTRVEKKKILDESIEVTGFHGKHAILALRRAKVEALKEAPRVRLYDDAAVTALTILWEAADRICGKRLKEAIPTLVAAMERHGHLQLDTEVRPRLLAMSAATMDRLHKPIREIAKQGRRRTTILHCEGALSCERSAIGMIHRRAISEWTWSRTAEVGCR